MTSLGFPQLFVPYGSSFKRAKNEQKCFSLIMTSLLPTVVMVIVYHLVISLGYLIITDLKIKKQTNGLMAQMEEKPRHKRNFCLSEISQSDHLVS